MARANKVLNGYEIFFFRKNCAPDESLLSRLVTAGAFQARPPQTWKAKVKHSAFSN